MKKQNTGTLRVVRTACR